MCFSPLVGPFLAVEMVSQLWVSISFSELLISSFSMPEQFQDFLIFFAWIFDFLGFALAFFPHFLLQI